MQKVDLFELRRLHEAATKGKWVDMADEAEEDATAWAESTDCQRDADHAQYIAAVHNALPALLDELEAAREEVESMRNDRDGALYFIHLNGHELQHADGLLEARDRRMKLIGAAEELRACATLFGSFKAIQPATKFWQGKEEGYAEASRELLRRAAKLRQEAEANG